VVVGPHHDVVVEEVQELERASALRVVRNSGDLESVLDTWLRDPSAAASAGRRAAETASGARGAAGRTLEWLVERGVLPAKGRHG
jgi:3-deoxy-D-manno-octulosonic-acid transferase